MLGNWIDLIIIFYLLVHFVSGFRKGFFSILVALFGLIFSLVLSFFTYSYSANILVSNFAIDVAYANVLGFFANIFIFKIIIIILIYKLLPKTIMRIKDSLLNKMIGGFISLAYGLIVIFLIFSITLSFSLPNFMNEELHASTAGNFIERDPLKLNDNFKSIFGNVLKTTIDKLDFLTVETEDEEPINLDCDVSDLKFDEKMEMDMLEMVNRERVSRGFSKLVVDEKARAVARKHGVDMFENGYFSHTNLEGKTSFDRMKDGNVEFSMAGENLALSEDLLSAHNGLMKSPGHRKNILQPFFHRVGIGVVNGGPCGIIFVQNFAD